MANFIPFISRILVFRIIVTLKVETFLSHKKACIIGEITELFRPGFSKT